MGLLQNTIHFTEKTREAKVKSIEAIVKKYQDSDQLNENEKEFLSRNIKLYLQVIYYCKIWRMKTDLKQQEWSGLPWPLK